MTDDARTQLQKRFAKVGAKALVRLQQLNPHLQGKTLEETVLILKEDERRRKWGLHPFEDLQQTLEENGTT
jgi:hypothetical protein